jgi:hypothetical protein
MSPKAQPISDRMWLKADAWVDYHETVLGKPKPPQRAKVLGVPFLDDDERWVVYISTKRNWVYCDSLTLA